VPKTQQADGTYRGVIVDLTAVWRKSGRNDSGGCVEIHFVNGHVAVRDSKDRNAAVLLFTPLQWQAFIDRARDGEFDLSPSKSEHSAESLTVDSEQIDLREVFRAGSAPVALAAGAATGSKLFLVAAVLYYRPVYSFLTTILEALAERWARRIRRR
jgi:hypothetical protein